MIYHEELSTDNEVALVFIETPTVCTLHPLHNRMGAGTSSRSREGLTSCSEKLKSTQDLF